MLFNNKQGHIRLKVSNITNNLLYLLNIKVACVKRYFCVIGDDNLGSQRFDRSDEETESKNYDMTAFDML